MKSGCLVLGAQFGHMNRVPKQMALLRILAMTFCADHAVTELQCKHLFWQLSYSKC